MKPGESVLGIIWRTRRMPGYAGRTFLLYAFLYSLGRFVIEYFRGDKLTFTIVGRDISSAMTISLLVMMLVLYLHWRLKGTGEFK